MTQPRVTPAKAGRDLPTFTILVNGEELPQTIGIYAVSVVQGVNRISTAEILVRDGNAAEEDFKISNEDFFKPGNEIEITAGYHQEEDPVFKGIVIRHCVQIKSNGESMLSVECKDKAVKMTIGRKNAYFYDQKDSEIIEELAAGHGLETEVEETAVEHAEMVQYYATDWDFVVSRAEMNGMLVYTEDGKLVVSTPDPGQEPAVSLVYGSTIYEMEAEMDARHQYPKVKSVSWDSDGQELVELESDDPGITEQGNLNSADLSSVIGLEDYRVQHIGQVVDQELDAWGKAHMLRSRLAKIVGRVKCQGVSEVRPGKVLELAGVGERFNGNAFVAGVRHDISGGNWFTHIQFGLSQKWFCHDYTDVVEQKASGMLPGVQGLQIAQVIQLEEDPDGQDRVKVNIPTIAPGEDGIWARVATLDAGENRGSFFRPEVGDEVVLGFLNDDPRDPVILGMLNSGSKPAPITASDDNHEKGFITRSEIKLLFNDDKNTVVIETPKGNKVEVLDDDDVVRITQSGGNVVEVNSSGISLGKKDSSDEPAVLGDTLQSFLEDLCQALIDVKVPTAIGPQVLLPSLPIFIKLKATARTIKSSKVTLVK